MQINRFALGARFDFLTEEPDDNAIKELFEELSRALPIKYMDSLQIYGGRRKLFEQDRENVYTIVFMNGSLKQMRKLYRKIDNDATLRCMMEKTVPYVQNNVIRDYDGMEFFGTVGKDGLLYGGSGRDIRFYNDTMERKKYTQKGSLLLALNSFKGTLSAQEASMRLQSALRKTLPHVQTILLPTADGGDGTIEAAQFFLQGQRHTATVTAPNGDSIEAAYFVRDGGGVIIEMAKASGLALITAEERDPLHLSSRGTGELMLRALSEGLFDMYIGIGGSATNDCGIGAAIALGYKFLDGDGNPVTDAEHMSDIAVIDDSNVAPLLKRASITVMCDVDNPLTGNNGATYAFAPQKGADAEMIETLESGMRNMERLLNQYAKRDIGSIKGAGAAGGMGAMLIALANASIVSGAEAILEFSGFDSQLKRASLVVTGEGRVDRTSLDGKITGVIKERCMKAGIPYAIIAGCKGAGGEAITENAVLCEYCSDSDTDDAHQSFDNAAMRLAMGIAKLQ